MTLDTIDGSTAAGTSPGAPRLHGVLLETLFDGVAMTDLEGVITFASQQMANLLGIASPAELIGRRNADFIFAGDRSRAIREIARVVEEGTVKRMHYTLLRSDGTAFAAEMNASLECGTNGHPSGVMVVIRDISDRLRSSHALQQSEDRFLKAFQANPAAIAISRVSDGMIIDVNRAYERLLEYDRDELVGRTSIEVGILTNADDRRAAVDAVATNRKLHAVELLVRSKSGRLLDVLFSAERIQFDGEYCFLSTLYDITDRHRAEEQRALLASIVDSSEDAIIGKTLDGRITSWNRGAESLYGYRADQMVGRPIQDLVPADHMDDIALILGEVRAGRRVQRFETVRERSDGSLVDVSLTVSPIRGPDGTIVGASTIAHDISARRLVEQELRQSQQRLQTVVDCAPVVLFALDADARFTLFEGAGLARIGFTSGEAVGHTVHEFLPDPALEDYARRAFAGEQVEDLAYVMGATFAFRLLPMADATGKVTEVVGVAIDVTDQMGAEAEVRRFNADLEALVVQRTTQLQAANRELAAFTYAVSHDLRAPLRAIDGFSLALLEDCSDQLDELGSDYLRRIRDGVGRMSKLIGDLLSLSRETQGEMRVEPVDLSAMVADIVRELRESHIDRNVTIVCPEKVTAQADSRLMHAVLENLLRNAWKFTSKHQSARIEFGVLETGTQPVFFVRDDGAGFDMKYADKLFGAFQRLHGTTEFEGTGIGLTTVQRIISRHGGRVWAEGAVEQGATFYFTLSPSTAAATDGMITP